MKKFILFYAIIFSLGIFTAAFADVLKGIAIEEISTESPKEIISIKLSKNFLLDNEIELKKGYILTGKMIDIKAPKDWHKNASFTFTPMSYTDLNGKEHKISKEINGAYRQKMKQDYKHSEITVGPFLFSPAYIDDTKKIIQGETKEVWEDYANRSTPWGKGNQIEIKPNETIYFNF